MQVVIRHPKTGAEYEIDSVDFRRGKHYHQVVDGRAQPGQTFEEAGFKIVSLADGSPYEPPKSQGEHAT